MKLAEQVTFGGSGLDRAAELRGEAERLARDPGARAVVLWRGRVLMAGAGLARMAPGAAVLAGAPWVFLGRGPEPLFACDLSAWQSAAAAGAPGPGRALEDRVIHPELPGDGFADLRAVMAMLGPRDAELAATARALFEWHRSHRFCAFCGAQSTPDQAGWRRLCPACGRAHFPRTDPVVIMLVTHGNRVLLGRAPGWPERMYSLLAGYVEPGETLEAAVRREVHEEARISCGPVRYLASQPWAFPASLMIGCHAQALSTEITCDPVELEHALWMRREDAALALNGGHGAVAPARRGSIARFLLENWVADRLA